MKLFVIKFESDGIRAIQVNNMENACLLTLMHNFAPHIIRANHRTDAYSEYYELEKMEQF